MLELEASSGKPPARTTPEVELLPTSAMSKRTTLEGRPLMFLAVRIIPVVKPRPQLGITQDLVSLVDGRHFLLCRLLGRPLRVRLVWMVFLRHASVGGFDLALCGVAGHAEDFVVVFGFGAFEEHLGFLEEGVDLLRGWVVLFGVVEG